MKVVKIFYINWLGLDGCRTIESESVNKAIKLFYYECFVKRKRKIKIQYVTSNGYEVPNAYIDKLLEENKNVYKQKKVK